MCLRWVASVVVVGLAVPVKVCLSTQCQFARTQCQRLKSNRWALNANSIAVKSSLYAFTMNATTGSDIQCKDECIHIGLVSNLSTRVRGQYQFVRSQFGFIRIHISVASLVCHDGRKSVRRPGTTPGPREAPARPRESPGSPGRFRKSQEALGDQGTPRDAQEVPRELQEAPGKSRRSRDGARGGGGEIWEASGRPPWWGRVQTAVVPSVQT